MKTCKYCGGEVIDTAKKCKHCGEWLDIICPYCEGEVSPQATICPHCGEKIKEGNEQETIPQSEKTKICKYCEGENPVTAKQCVHCGELFIEEHKQKSLNQNAQIKNDANNTKTLILVACITLVVFLVIIILIAFNKSGGFDNLNSNAIEKIIKTANATEQGYEDVGQENTIYKLMEKDYNQISSFKDRQTGANTYAFRVQTDWKYEYNNEDFFNYELGRIIINPKDIKKSKCTYNFRASLDNKPVKWIECSDKSFVESIPKIAELKNKAYQQYKNNEYGKLINLYSECMLKEGEGLYDPKCAALPYDAGELLDGWYHGRHEALINLRNTTL